jgi:glycosyltransferase involved in cell wall biosynthesis
MRVALITRSTLFAVPGGDTVQIEQTAKHLAAMGIATDIKPADEQIDYDQYDLLHFFNITRPADLLRHSQKSGKPFVVSTILCNYSEYDKHHRKGIGMVFSFLPNDWIEYAKTMARCLLGRDKLISLDYVWKGQRKSIEEILNKAALILPNSESEYERVVTSYACKPKYMVVPNGINTNTFGQQGNAPRDGQLILCVARIEGIKNQLNLIKALNNTSFNLLLIGSHSPSQTAYYNECRNEAADNIQFINHIPQQQLVAYYQKAKVHILPSWFETTGLSSIEGAVMGCNIVITDKGDAKEYFGSDAFYCDPASPQSILNAVQQASIAGFNESLRTKILQQYTWQHAAKQTLKAYQQTIA